MSGYLQTKGLHTQQTLNPKHNIMCRRPPCCAAHHRIFAVAGFTVPQGSIWVSIQPRTMFMYPAHGSIQWFVFSKLSSCLLECAAGVFMCYICTTSVDLSVADASSKHSVPSVHEAYDCRVASTAPIKASVTDLFSCCFLSFSNALLIN